MADSRAILRRTRGVAGAAAAVDAVRPGESKLQLTALKSQGACTIDVAPDGSMNVKRLSASGADDAFSVTA